MERKSFKKRNLFWNDKYTIRISKLKLKINMYIKNIVNFASSKNLNIKNVKFYNIN